MALRHFARCECNPDTIHRIVDKRDPGYWVTTLIKGECKKRSKLEGLVLWNHLDLDYPEDEESGDIASRALKPN